MGCPPPIGEVVGWRWWGWYYSVGRRVWLRRHGPGATPSGAGSSPPGGVPGRCLTLSSVAGPGSTPLGGGHHLEGCRVVARSTAPYLSHPTPPEPPARRPRALEEEVGEWWGWRRAASRLYSCRRSGGSVGGLVLCTGHPDPQYLLPPSPALEGGGLASTQASLVWDVSLAGLRVAGCGSRPSGTPASPPRC